MRQRLSTDSRQNTIPAIQGEAVLHTKVELQPFAVRFLKNRHPKLSISDAINAEIGKQKNLGIQLHEGRQAAHDLVIMRQKNVALKREIAALKQQLATSEQILAETQSLLNKVGGINE